MPFGIFKPLKELAEKHKCLFLLNHHIGKSKEGLDSPSKTDFLGSQAIESSCRGVLILKKRADGKRILTIVKGNHSSDEIKNKGIVLSFSVKKGFEVTGETVIYEGEHFPSDDILMLKNEVLALYPVLNSYKKVADKLKEKGFKKVDKNKVGEIWKKYRPSVTQPKKKAGRIGSDNSTDLTQINAENVSDNSDHSLIISCEGDKQTEELKVEPTITQTLIQKIQLLSIRAQTQRKITDG
ncbi:MAG: hypothetical protein IPF69_15865 [Chitinophagaceae bacterium]|nr:hypothetical protein [Chitinophagaceae bacterium]